MQCVMWTHKRIHCRVEGQTQARVLLEGGVLRCKFLLQRAQTLVTARWRGRLGLGHIRIKLVHQGCCICQIHLTLPFTLHANPH